MKPTREYLQLANDFVVKGKDLSYNNALNIGKIMHEMRNLSEIAILIAFGEITYPRVRNSSYHLDFIGKAHKGDMVKLELDAVYSFGLSLEVHIVAKGFKDKIIAKGSFVFNAPVMV